jgi:two-component system sensor histidine kinase TctE
MDGAEGLEAQRSAGTNSETPSSDTQIQRSLFGEILDWILIPLLLLWPISIAVTYVVAKSIANQPFDHALDDTVTVLAQQVKEIDGKIVARIPDTARDFLHADGIDNVYYEISGPHGQYVSGDRDIPIPAEEEPPSSDSTQFRDDVIHGTAVRVAYAYIDLRRAHTALGNAGEPHLALIQVAEHWKNVHSWPTRSSKA